MKRYSLTSIGLMAILFCLQLSCSTEQVVKDSDRPLKGARETACLCSSGYDGSYGASNGYYPYPQKTVDLSGCPEGTMFQIDFSPQDNPNRFTLKGDGGVIVAESGQQPWTSGYNGWLGTSSNPGPWGMSGISTGGTETVTFVKTGSGIYTLNVETVITNNYSDSWSVYVYCIGGPGGPTGNPTVPGCPAFTIGTPPNAFTPNNDGVNDTFVISDSNNGNGPLNANKLDFVVYNRWGAKVYETSYTNPSGINGGVSLWNGTIGNTVAPSGVYYYYLTAHNSCGGTQVFKGWISVFQ